MAELQDQTKRRRGPGRLPVAAFTLAASLCLPSTGAAQEQILCTLETNYSGYLRYPGTLDPVPFATICKKHGPCEGDCASSVGACKCIQTDANGHFKFVDTMYNTTRDDTTAFGDVIVYEIVTECGPVKCDMYGAWDAFAFECPPPYFHTEDFFPTTLYTVPTSQLYSLPSISSVFEPRRLGTTAKFSLSWTSVVGATNYRLQVDTAINAPPFTKPMWLDTIVLISYVLIDDLPDQMRWRARAQNDCDVSDWTSPQILSDIHDDETASQSHTSQTTVNYPNPFNASTIIRFDLEVISDWSLTIYNILGQTIRRYDGVQDEGTQLVEWHGDDGVGNPMPSGMYFYRVETSRWTESRKMVLLR